MRTGRRELIRDLNRALVLNLVREQRAISRAEIARISGLSPSTVTSITASLLADELLVEDESAKGGRRRVSSVGRPATLLRVDTAARHVVGIKLAPESLTVTVTDLDATPLTMVRLPHRARSSRREIFRLIASAIQGVLADAGLSAETLLGVGIGLPGEVHPSSGDVVRSPLPGWAAAGFAGALERHLQVPVLVDNDVNTLTVAEHLYGSGRGLDHLLVVSVGRGIGMGAVVDGVVARGARGALGEIGHIVVVPGGRACWCGRQGCLEAEAAEPAIVAKVLAALGRLVAPDELAAVADDDVTATAILSSAGRTVGHAVAAAISLFDPHLVVVSGEGVRLGHHYLDALRDGVHERLSPGVIPDLVFEPWGDEAWARGAASLVLRELFIPAHLRGSGRLAGLPVAPRGEPSSAAAS